MLGGGNSGAWHRPGRTSVCPGGQASDGEGVAGRSCATRGEEADGGASPERDSSAATPTRATATNATHGNPARTNRFARSIGHLVKADPDAHTRLDHAGPR